MKNLKINPDLFVLEHGENYILYLPLKSTSVFVNADTIKLLNAIDNGEEVDIDMDIIQELNKLGVFDDSRYTFHDSLYEPTSVTFLPSFSCNLNCLYCYSNGGDLDISRISINAAKKAIDFVIKNALHLNKKNISVGFHGGGEPMMLSNRVFIENVVEYAKHISGDHHLQCHISAATNGIDIDKFDILWLKENFAIFSISLDGPPDIQNHQRPRRGVSHDSHSFVVNTIGLFDQNDIDYEIRATITKDSVGRLTEIIKYFGEISSRKKFHIEPLFECGRCKTSKIEAPNPIEFIKNYAEAFRMAKGLGIKIYYSGASMNRISNRFCGAAGDNYFITPDSKVTTCLEACRVDEIEDELFIIGKFNNDTNDYEYDHNKISYLKTRNVSNMKSCVDCFCKYSCSGDCLAKVLKTNGNVFDTTNHYRCEINTAITEILIKDMIC